MRKVELRMYELEKYTAVKAVSEGRKTKTRAATELDLSIRQINRLLRKYSEMGKQAFVHGNRDRKPITAFSNEFKDLIEELYITKYFDCTYTLFNELLAERENIFISVDETRKILKSKYILSPKSHKATKRALKNELQQRHKNIKSKKEKNSIQSKILSLENIHPLQPRCVYFGEEIQMDASEHLWFANKKTHLHAAIDDSTGKVVGAYFDSQETLFGYYSITKQILENYGIPFKIKTDRRTVFDYKRKGVCSDESDTFTQYSYAAKQLGIKLETSSVPEFKARVERLFGTLQHRLTVWLRLEHVNSIEEANLLLPKLIDKFNAQFALHENNTKSVFEKQLSDEKINLTLAILSRRIIDSGHSIRFRNKYYRLINSNGFPIFFAKGTKCIVIEAYDKSLFATVDESIFALEEIPKVQAYSPNFDYIPDVKQKYVSIPKMLHPWKAKTFEKFLDVMTHNFILEHSISTS